MPWFHHKSEDEQRQEAEDKARRAEETSLQEQSRAAIERGGIPIQAQRRLDDLRQREGSFFTSDLSVNEFLLARQAGVQPLSQVMGSSIYHVGFQYTPYYSSQELGTLSRAYNHSRELALGRLQHEAERVGADAVVGVHVERASYDWGEDLIEFNTVGTAVRLQGAPGKQKPALTNLSGQDFWKLHRSGYWPRGVVAGSTVFYVVAGWQSRMATSVWGRWANQELTDFTAGLYQARHTAMSHVHQQAYTLGGIGVVGMDLEQSEEEYEVELANDQKRTDLIVTFHVIGTVVDEMSEQGKGPSIYAALELR